jgi:AcrR family transcriptional regulator
MPAKGQRRKQQIIDAAKKMFIEQGFQSTHIGQVCEELNIARGTVYQYFGNKREILYAILEGVEEELDDIFDLDDLQEYLSAKPDAKKLNSFLNDRMVRCIRALVSEPIVIKLLFKEIPGIDEEVIEEVTSFIDHNLKTLVGDIEEIKKRGWYKQDIDSKLVATLVIGGVLLLVQQYNDQVEDILEQSIVDATANIFLHGIL